MNVPFLLRIIVQLIQLLLQSGLFCDDDRSMMNGLLHDVENVRKKK